MPTDHANPRQLQPILQVLAAAAFLIFFQSYLFAPLIPAFSREFNSSTQRVGLLIPAYLLPYAFSTLFYGPLSDRVGRGPVLLSLLGLMVIATAGSASAGSIYQLLVWRMTGGIAAGGIIPIALALLGDLFPFEDRGRALGWIFGAVAGGSAFGSTCGAVLYPYVGWRIVLVALAAASLFVLIVTHRYRRLLVTHKQPHPLGPRHVAAAYLALLRDPRGAGTYACIFLNGLFHSGVFTWLGLYFSRRFALGEIGIGLALIGYGIPGFLLGPVIGRLADRLGRRTLLPAGMGLAALSALAMIPHAPLPWAALVVTILSLGFDMSHPLLVGIVTTLNPERRGTAMGMNAFVLFMGFGMGSLLFQQFLRSGFPLALSVFGAMQLGSALLALKLFKGETVQPARLPDPEPAA